MCAKRCAAVLATRSSMRGSRSSIFVAEVNGEVLLAASDDYQRSRVDTEFGTHHPAGLGSGRPRWPLRAHRSARAHSR
jgi:hypothetical protein